MDHDLSVYSTRKTDIAFPIGSGVRLLPLLVAEQRSTGFQLMLN